MKLASLRNAASPLEPDEHEREALGRSALAHAQRYLAYIPQAPSNRPPAEVFSPRLEPGFTEQAEKRALARYFHARLSEKVLIRVRRTNLSVVASATSQETGNADEFNERLLQHVQEERRVMLSGTRIDGRHMLRCAILSFRTHIEHVDEAVAALRRGVDSRSVPPEAERGPQWLVFRRLSSGAAMAQAAPVNERRPRLSVEKLDPMHSSQRRACSARYYQAQRPRLRIR